jgi:hypothetical protein
LKKPISWSSITYLETRRRPISSSSPKFPEREFGVYRASAFA